MAKAAAGYSGTPLPQKLGIKPGARIVALGSPRPYATLAGPLPEGATVTTRLPQRAGFIHLFTRSRTELAAKLPRLEHALEDAGILWVSWPKQASGVATDVTENIVRELALAARLVDVKVCAVDATWSGLKLVRRITDRERKRD